MKISVITPTNGRPEALELCARWLDRQSQHWDEWIIADKPVSQRENLESGLKLCTGDYIAFVEDDDYYAPHYFEALQQLLKKEPGVRLAGILPCVYYNLPAARYRALNVRNYAPLFQTVMHRSLVDTFLNSWSPGKEIEFWKATLKQGFRATIAESYKLLSLGIKGMPGTPGQGVGHNTGLGTWAEDPNRNKLKNLLGEDYKYYEPFCGSSNVP